jgi:Flp pilus assembly pilin Flp
MRNTLKRFLDDERGSAVFEYSVLVGGIALAIITIIQAFGIELGSLFHSIAAGIQSLNSSK